MSRIRNTGSNPPASAFTAGLSTILERRWSQVIRRQRAFPVFIIFLYVFRECASRLNFWYIPRLSLQVHIFTSFLDFLLFHLHFFAVSTKVNNSSVSAFLQCWGFVTFWWWSGSADPYLWLMDPDPGGPKNMRIRIPNTAFLFADLCISLYTGEGWWRLFTNYYQNI